MFWWLEHTGAVTGARLCTELEWEYAARGADGRDCPHGRPLEPDDANYDVTHTKDALGYDEVGSHPASTNPFGLADISGNVYEYAKQEHGDGAVVRGSAFWSDRKTANLANRSVVPVGTRAVEIGTRLCANLPADALR